MIIITMLTIIIICFTIYALHHNKKHNKQYQDFINFQLRVKSIEKHLRPIISILQKKNIIYYPVPKFQNALIFPGSMNIDNIVKDITMLLEYLNVERHEILAQKSRLILKKKS